jgi:hypothetical protein
MLRRTQKLEKHQRLAMEKKQEARKERRANQRAETSYSETVELGSTHKVEKPKKKTIQDINDVEALAELKAASISRGKK